MMIQRGVGSLLRDSESLPLNVDYFCRRSVHQGSLPFRVGVSEEIRDALTAIRNKLSPEYLESRLQERITKINSEQEAACKACVSVLDLPLSVFSSVFIARWPCLDHQVSSVTTPLYE
ncbi:hypothetical protein Pmar_PMAR001517 [Perkinsus marinus ATCC 50983]|uniref:Uncharacterized protein n=1 Tax=Perkinsus marinus (strain ATCC 50983 / TXsc) TaxID=423536 RepID=C5K9D8_PERM5|nr:hypothetical protein Pmar_PMAR001517 [Perkinsus marinus ATCC 50983]EER18904.1 hypothetical protein Pmar_PMAR001517 [Perkinsus marinus ATCC 50983]|eukprot:XP_002787108.1 hypothetical protein Pmar_PMAR001517 [Perkinsus marinus ATCC 50983]